MPLCWNKKAFGESGVKAAMHHFQGAERFLFLIFSSLLWAITACTSAGNQTHITTPYNLQQPPHFVKMLLPADNPLTEEGVALGRMLFYDPILSSSDTLSCGSCHAPQKALSDGLALSRGAAGRQGVRSSLSLANVGYYYKNLFWDGRSASLEAQALIPIMEVHEMNSDWASIEGKLRNHDAYPELFRKAFGIKEKAAITRLLVAKALAQFERTLISADAKYDQVLAGKAEFTAAEARGREIFFDSSTELPASECSHCHVDPLFTNLDFFNNGIEKVDGLNDFPDAGRGKITGIKYDNGKFRVPTLRNLELTAPYMHDGRFETLEQVLEHYISGGHFAENLNPNVRHLHFSERDKADLIAFLKTLTDTSFIHNPAFANPFKPTADEVTLSENTSHKPAK